MLKKNEAIEQLKPDTAVPNQPVKALEQNPVRKRGFLMRSILFISRSAIQIILMVALLWGANVGMQRLLASAPETPKRPVFKTVFTVDTTLVKRSEFQPKITIYGQTAASRTVDLRSLVAGEITSVNEKLRAGEKVEKGEPLFEIDRFTYEGALTEAKASLLENQAKLTEYQSRISSELSKKASNDEQLQLAMKDLERIKALRKRKTSTQKQVDDRDLVVSQRKQALEQADITLSIERARLDQQKAAISRLEWRVTQAERNLKDTVLVAPFSGIISASQAQAGRLVSANDVVVSMYETDKLDARFTLTDQRFARLQSDAVGIVGREVEVRWVIGGETFSYPAVIDRIGAQIASNRGGVEVFAKIKNTSGKAAIRPGAFVEIIVPDRKYSSHFQVPETSIFDNNTVYVVVKGELQSRAVKIAGFDGEMAIISEGLKDGDEVLTTRIAEIGNGLRVRKEGDPPVSRGKPKGQNGKAGDAKGTGKTVLFRYLPAEEKRKIVEEIGQAKGLDKAAWDALARPDRSALIAEFMKTRKPKDT